MYMDRIPKANNKIQRIKLVERLGFETLTPTTTLAGRHYDAVCPPNGTSLSASIPKQKCIIDENIICLVLNAVTRTPRDIDPNISA